MGRCNQLLTFMLLLICDISEKTESNRNNEMERETDRRTQTFASKYYLLTEPLLCLLLIDRNVILILSIIRQVLM